MDAGPPSPGFAFVDVGQGASLVMVGPSGGLYIVDSGPPEGASALLDVVSWTGRRVVDLWTHTHFDRDHVGAFSEVVHGPDRLPDTSDDLVILRLWDRGQGHLPDHLAANAYFGWVEQHVVEPEVALGSSHTGSQWWMSVVGRGPIEAASENERGLALCGEMLGTRIFVQGDLPADLALSAARTCGRVDLYWLGHHGAKDALDGGGEMLRALDPDLVVISSGQDNDYCHPHPDTLERLRGRAVVMLGLPDERATSACRYELSRWSEKHRWLPGGLWVPAG